MKSMSRYIFSKQTDIKGIRPKFLKVVFLEILKYSKMNILKCTEEDLKNITEKMKNLFISTQMKRIYTSDTREKHDIINEKVISMGYEH